MPRSTSLGTDPSHLRRSRTALLTGFACIAFAGALSACAPALNWREVRPAQADGLLASFPCKPDSVERRVVLPGLPDPVTVRLLSCRADGDIWTLSQVTVSDAAQVPVALRALAAATRGNVEAAAREVARRAEASPAALRTEVRATELAPVQVPRMTPQPDSRGWRFEGVRPGDDPSQVVPVVVTAWHFSHGLNVFQAAAWQHGEAASAQSGREGANTFLQGFHFPG